MEDELGFSTDLLWDYFHGPHASAIRTIHVEQDHAVNNIRRWLVGLLDFVAEMPPNEVIVWNCFVTLQQLVFFPGSADLQDH